MLHCPRCFSRKLRIGLLTGGIDIQSGRNSTNLFSVRSFDLLIDRIYCSECYTELTIPDDEVYYLQTLLETKAPRRSKVDRFALREKIKQLKK